MKQEYDRVSLHVHQQMTAYIDVSMCCTCGVLVLDEKIHTEWNHGQGAVDAAIANLEWKLAGKW